MPPHHRHALAIFALLAGIYLLTTGGHTYSIDEELMFGVSESLALRGSFALGVTSAGEQPDYGTYGPGQSLAALPFYLLGRGLALLLFSEGAYAWVTRAITGWLNPVVTAASAALLSLAAARIGHGQRAAIGAALIYGLGTLAWPHSKTFFSEPLTGLLLFSSFVVALHAAPGTHRRSLLLISTAGLLAGLAPAVKIQAALALPVLALHVGLWALLEERSTRHTTPGSLAWRAALLRLLAWGIGAGLALAALLLFQWALYGDPLRTGYGESGAVLQSLLNKNPWRGFYGLVLSPGKGIVWYTLPLLLWPLALWLFWRRSWHAALLCGLMVVVHLLFYARLSFWHGDGAWGPRYLNTVLPFLVLPLAAYLDDLRGWRTPWRSGVLALLLLLMVPVQVGGLAINLVIYVEQSEGTIRYYQPRHATIVRHVEMVAQQLEQRYRLAFAGERVVLRRGFAYSEGHRSQGQQVPRWTLPRAEIELRPPPAQHLQLSMELMGCRPQPVPPAPVRLSFEGRPLLTDTPCPPRRYHLLLPARSATLVVEADPWEPRDVGIERKDGPLGVRLHMLDVRADGQALPLDGALVPIVPLPADAGPVTIRQWTSDYRYGHWDFWWWFLAHSDFARGPSLALAAIWLALAGGLIAWGGRHVAATFVRTDSGTKDTAQGGAACDTG